MPKGVDHHKPARFPLLWGRVQKSLMPKGVDHFGVENLAAWCDGAKIFDAERR